MLISSSPPPARHPAGAPANRTRRAQPEPTSSARRLVTLLGIPATDGNEVVVLRNGIEIFPSMLEAIDAASHTVDIVTYVYWSGDIARRFAESLANAARRGCRVRVLLDAFGCHRIDPGLIDTMTSAGAEVRRFRPFVDGKVPEPADANDRTHRKILVCDGRVGFCGGVGIADEWDGDARNEHEWRDTHLRICGPAVAGLSAAFLDNWADDHEDDYEPAFEAPVVFDGRGSSQVLTLRASSEMGSTDMWRFILALVTLARTRLRIATAYFNPDDRIIAELLAAVDRGVEVTVLVPGEHADKRFDQLAAEAGREGDAGHRPLDLTTVGSPATCDHRSPPREGRSSGGRGTGCRPTLAGSCGVRHGRSSSSARIRPRFRALWPSSPRREDS